MELFFHLKPSFDCVMRTRDICTELQKNKILSFLINSPSPVLALSFYPSQTEENSLNFTVLVNLKTKTLASKNPNADLILFPNDNLLLTVREFFFANQKPFNVQTKTFTFGDTNHTFFYQKNSPFSLRIENAKRKFLEAEYPCQVHELEFKTSTNSLFCFGKTAQKTFIVCILKYKNNAYSLTTLEEVELLEEKDGTITTLKKANDIQGHAFTKTYTFSPTLSVETALVYGEDEPSSVAKREIVPYAFFDAVKCKNFDIARSFLCEKLSKKLTDKHLEKFFGDFLFSHQPLSENLSEIALIYSENPLQKTAKLFDITMDENDKISNITDL